jgi:uncharacterized protein DUF6985
MFGLFKSEPYRDAQLGKLCRSGRHWRGSITLAPCGTFRLSLAGGRAAPGSLALKLAKELPLRIQTLMPKIQSGLFEHYAPYKEAVEAGEQTGSPCPQIASAEAVLLHVKPAHVLIEPLKDVWRVEIAFKTEWDIEHTVAAIFRDWQFIELNGSVRGQ